MVTLARLTALALNNKIVSCEEVAEILRFVYANSNSMNLDLEDLDIKEVPKYDCSCTKG